jgi:hypothetical protein
LKRQQALLPELRGNGETSYIPPRPLENLKFTPEKSSYTLEKSSYMLEKSSYTPEK